MNKPDWIIRIVAVLPARLRYGCARSGSASICRWRAIRGAGNFSAMGVLSLPRSVPAQWLAVFRGRAEPIAGYAVEALPAVDILAHAHPEAAAWWRENTPHLIAPKRYLVFHEEVCRIADI